MNAKDGLKRLASLGGIAGASLLFSFPLLAQYSPYYSFWNRPAYVLGYESQDEVPNLAQTLTTDSQFQTLAADLEKAGLLEVLQQEGPFTIFAPTDAAFDALSYTQSQKLAQSEYRKQVLEYHVIAREISPEEIPGTIETVSGDVVTITVSKDNPYQFWVNDEVKIVPPQLDNNGKPITSLKFASNGTIVPIEQVLLPTEQ